MTLGLLFAPAWPVKRQIFGDEAGADSELTELGDQ
jgi:hypothetical protein